MYDMLNALYDNMCVDMLCEMESQNPNLTVPVGKPNASSMKENCFLFSYQATGMSIWKGWQKHPYLST